MSYGKQIRRVLSLGLALACLMQLTACFDPEPAKISIACTANGLQRICDVVLESKDGRVQRRLTTNIRGIGEFKYLVPGEYELSFVDSKDKAWPALRTVSLRSGQVLPLRVELTEREDTMYVNTAS